MAVKTMLTAAWSSDDGPFSEEYYIYLATEEANTAAAIEAVTWG